MEKLEDVVCNFCGCLCDDLEVTVEENKITRVSRACVIGRNRLLSPVEPARYRVDGEDCSLAEAVAAAAAILSSAKNPLIYGLSSTTCEAQKKAVEIAEITGANLDSTASVCHGPGSMARQMVGLPTCTLGEVKNRADLIIFWGCNPAEAHLRHMERYAVNPKGMYIPEGKKGRKIVIVDVRETQPARVADTFIQLRQGCDYECISVLRALLAGESLAVEEAGGVGIESWKELL
ncbi:MAG: formylmethanofuran dehydrogenase subunit B, partial [Firmicutes bacterium]|nr:formylmethanofuran dehydrogenase subunit B [Bacillota bacterium]